MQHISKPEWKQLENLKKNRKHPNPIYYYKLAFIDFYYHKTNTISLKQYFYEVLR